ncbi:FecR family protein [Pedobacter sp. KR3-3]|uniref:FecR family protein n=1 Tax=Pedobacter albus TaxID=3113905 RepID=A0ABU7I5D3_9SPHI|nr:FecR family protein [Pedobacter sp. KR3-3]MEE1944680.1 FecR family protein [Pedobacter sp. KR3-3]
MQKIDAKTLLQKYRANQCTEEELALLESWYVVDELEPIDLTLEDLQEAKADTWQQLPIHQKKVVRLNWSYQKIAAVAAVFAILFFGTYFFLNRNQPQSQTKNELAVAKIVPGGKKAILTLGNGTSIVLSNAKNGKLADQNDVHIFKTEDDALVYNGQQDANQGTNDINTLTIPSGGYYSLTLADGTKVWLNSESSLTYPTAFNGKERVVKLSGEGYFEVAHRNNQAFKVIANNQTVEVLGTHFNINAYANERATVTTLLQGSVKVSTSGGTSKMLAPGLETVVVKDNISIRPADEDNAIAWTENNFVFNKEELGSIMRKISRWYDIDIDCPPNMAKLSFSGSISRSRNIKQVLKIMELTNSVHFKFEERRIIIMP